MNGECEIEHSQSIVTFKNFLPKMDKNRNRKRRREACHKIERGSTESRVPWRTIKIYIGIFASVG